MADLFLDIRYTTVDALISETGEIRFQGSFDSEAALANSPSQQEEPSLYAAWHEGELSELIRRIRSESGIALDQIHLIISPDEIRLSTHKLPRLPHDEALKLVTRKIAGETRDEFPPVAITPMGSDQKSQSWLAEYVPTDTLRFYRRECAAARTKLRTVTSALNTTMQAITPIREAIFNAHALFEITRHHLNAYYVSSSSLLLNQSLPLQEEDEGKGDAERDRTQKQRVFSIVNLIYRINSQYLSANAMTPLQKVWVCGGDAASEDLAAALRDAMDVESGNLDQMFGESQSSSSFVLQGFMRAYYDQTAVNFMTPDLLRRFPLRKRSGMVIYLTTALLALAVIASVEIKHTQLKKSVARKKLELASLKSSQTASAAFVKNLEALKQLTGRQILFYPILRELAMKLPDQVYLESLEYAHRDKHDFITITASFPHSHELGTQKTLSALMDEISLSKYLSRHSEPAVTISTQEEKKYVLVTFTCEVASLDTAK